MQSDFMTRGVPPNTDRAYNFIATTNLPILVNSSKSFFSSPIQVLRHLWINKKLKKMEYFKWTGLSTLWMSTGTSTRSIVPIYDEPARVKKRSKFLFAYLCLSTGCRFCIAPNSVHVPIIITIVIIAFSTLIKIILNTCTLTFFW